MKTPERTTEEQFSVTPARPRPDLDALFAPRKVGYLGADAALSIRLDAHRVAWLFGDTLLGAIRDGRRVIRKMIRNSIAIQHLDRPAAESIEWHFDATPGAERDFFLFESDESDRWFWPGTGFMHNGVLHVFGYVVGPGKGEFEALSFKLHRTCLLRIDNPLEHFSNWRFTWLPFDPGGSSAYFCAAHHVSDGFLHLVGFAHRRHDESVWPSVAARIPIDDLGSDQPGERCEIYTSHDGEPHWSKSPCTPHPIYRPGVSECTIIIDPVTGRLIVSSYDGRNPEFYLLAADRIEGPWTRPRLALEEEYSRPPSDCLSYAMRLHPHLASDEHSIVFTHVVNTRTLAELLEQLDAYYPRFHEVTLIREGTS